MTELSDSGSPSKRDTNAPAANLLEGVKVLDLTNVLSGPFCTYQLALLGAEVIKVENPGGGDLARQLGAAPQANQELMGASFVAQNAGKQSLTLNLKTEQGRDILRQLVKTADILVENFRPGVMDRLDVGYDTLSELNPKLVYCAISGFGATGPLRNKPAYDQVIQGMSGIMSVTGTPEVNPLRAGFPICDTMGGMTAAFAVVSALYAARVRGRGEFIDVSMLDSSLIALGWAVSNYLTADVEATPLGNENMTAAPSGTFETLDSPINIAANKQEHFQALCKVIGRPDLAVDPRFAERDIRKKNRAALNAEISEILRSQSAAHWESLLNAAGIPCGIVLSVAEALGHPQTLHRELVQELGADNAESRPIRVVRSGFMLGSGLPSARSTPPRLGQHTNDLLEQLGLSDVEIRNLRANGIV